MLGAEISFIKDYLNLEKLLNDNFTFHVSESENMGHVLIPPLLFIPVVEQAIHYLPGDRTSNPVHIYLLFQVNGNKLSFACIYPETYAKDKTMGLDNLRKRLHLLYGDNFQLEMKQGDKNHVMSLQICL